MKKGSLILACLSVFVLVNGCGVSEKTLRDAEQRIEVLKNKGVPDSALSRAKVFLYQARSARERGDRGLAAESKDSMLTLIAAAEAIYAQKSEELKPVIDSLRRVIKKERDELSGLQLRVLDSMVAVADSFASMAWVLQTETTLREAAGSLDRLTLDESRAKELKPLIPGKWQSVQVHKSQTHKEVHMPEYKIFDFFRNGKVTYVEKGKGRRGTHLKLDYEFISNGTWDMRGDTICLFIDRFQRVRERAEEKHVTDGKVEWKTKAQAPFDSTINDGSQDRFITYNDLKMDFKRIKRY